MSGVRSLLPVAALGGLMLIACGDDEGDAAGSGAGSQRPVVVATTNILGDVIEAFAGEQVEVVTVMPIGADPHTFQASARQVDRVLEADALVVNGAGFEEGLLDVVDAATDDGVPTFAAISTVDTIEVAAHEHGDDHGEDDGDDHGGDHGRVDPHFFTDPARMATSVDAMADFLIDSLDDVDGDALRAAADAYVAELEALDREVEELVAALPENRRVLVTNHEVFGYFADRYGFEVVGAIVPAGSTADSASAGDLADLAVLIEDEGVPAIFADTSSSHDLARTLAAEVGTDVEVVELFSESLGGRASGGATYLEMVRTNARRIAAALSA